MNDFGEKGRGPNGVDVIEMYRLLANAVYRYLESRREYERRHGAYDRPAWHGAKPYVEFFGRSR